MTSLSLARGIQFGDLVLTDYPFLTEFGMDYSAGDLVTSVLSSFLQDGDLEVSQRRGNMTLTIPLLIEGTDLLELAQAEAALALEAQKATNTLTVIPGDGFGPPTVFDTFEADVSFQFDDKLEQAAMRRLVLTIRALPFGRSTAMVNADALVPTPGAPVTTVINDGSSAAGWSATNGSAPVSSGGIVSTTVAASADAFLNYTTTINATTTPFVYVDSDLYTPQMFVTTSSGRVVAPLMGNILNPAGTRRIYFRLPADITALSFGTYFGSPGDLVSVDQVVKTNVPPAVGTTRQLARRVQVAGSARTQGQVEVYSPTSSLGDVLVYTNSTDSYVPALRGYALTGTADSTLVSGQYTTLSSTMGIGVPLSQMPPGMYLLMARLSSPAGGARSLTWSTNSAVGTTAVGRTLTGTAGVTGSAYQFVPLGTVNLPTSGFRDVSSNAFQRFFITDTNGTNSARLDEFYAFNLTTGRLSIVGCGTGTPAPGGASSRLWLDAATVATRVPSVMRGTAANGSDAFYAGDSIVSTTAHEFVAPATNVFAVTTNATDSQITLRHFPRWLGHAAS